MNILALITARGGSKRLPGKNIRTLAGKPLIAWSIDVAKDISSICDILVSTDAPEIADIARSAGAMVPWLRPLELATDTSTSVDVCLHALDWYESKKGKVDGVLLLQPTSPLRSRETVLRGIEAFASHDACSVIGVSPAKTHPMWCFHIENKKLQAFVNDGGLKLRSQDLPAAYEVNGAFYLVSPKDLREKKSFYADDMLPLIMNNPEECIDIDTEWDWKMVEVILSMHEAGSK
ncbi:MAG: acylneuraminate cytidylyltransferase family protein [Deltaproteobacteria bacterium CG_4_10_14_0_2_um_filter_43_8]|nr:MAG: cytidylyltransferase [Deltaproteobacteria bacterium CG11_big_fil_rev_8_21_14_0_20_42_23]PJA19183.1 MAG: acylneuraminate cytidylyltransferase family protein [Deltaproteobacteria bacterium CG_4_10_14_0_2_um_filter_43_8]PJC64536.1 MAG: acylneuraminate cytidylyltransferase family protein [Deltaproteobacteria bacterium CG_4_9_14_0_2_um_filter_42_21]